MNIEKLIASGVELDKQTEFEKKLESLREKGFIRVSFGNRKRRRAINALERKQRR